MALLLFASEVSLEGPALVAKKTKAGGSRQAGKWMGSMETVLVERGKLPADGAATPEGGGAESRQASCGRQGKSLSLIHI